MNVDFQIASLRVPEDWNALAKILGGPNRVVNSIIRHLITVGVCSYLVETRYIDRDYSSDYRRFYALTFKTYDRHCKRVHFLRKKLNPSSRIQFGSSGRALEKTSRRSYRGFCVVRPLSGASIGRTALHAVGPTLKDLESCVTCRAEIRANLFGAELDVVGASFMQQDSRVGACAQVAIWTGARHMHQRYKYDCFP